MNNKNITIFSSREESLYNNDYKILWEEYFEHLEESNIFKCIEGKTVLEIGTANGIFWETFFKYNPKKVTGLDPMEYKHFVKPCTREQILNKSWEDFLPTQYFQVIICFGLIYKLHSPITLLEKLARSQPEYIILEDIYKFDNVKLNWDLKLNTVGALITNSSINTTATLKLPVNDIIRIMEQFGYTLEQKTVLDFSHKDTTNFGKEYTTQFLFKLD